MTGPSSGSSKAGKLLNRFATKAKFNFSTPLTMSWGETKARQSNLSAWFSVPSALSSKSWICKAFLLTPRSLGAIWWMR